MKAEEVLCKLTLEEKAILLTGKKNWFFNGVPRLGIRDFVVGDGPHGLRAYQNIMENGGYPETRMPATMFPSASAMASSFHPELLFEVGKVIGKECNHYHVDIILGPGINGKRSPLAGRNFEYYSEDPWLTAKMGEAFVKGVQSEGVGTSLKHFILNEQESSRRFISSQVDNRTFRELYALPFEHIVKTAKPLTIMPSYNKINGVYACQNLEILDALLKKEWGFEGITISDWGAVQDKKASIEATLDIEMPESEWKDKFIEDVKNGLYSESQINERALRVLKAYEWMLQNKNHGLKTNFEENHLIAKKVADESVCLLKNENAILPLEMGSRVIVLGEYAANPRINGGGSSDLMPYLVNNTLEEMMKYAKVSYFSSYQLTKDLADQILSSKDKIVVFVGTTAEIESEGFDRKNLDLPKEQVLFLTEVSKISQNRLIVVNSSGSAVNFEPFIKDTSALLQAFFLGSATGKTIADILFGVVNPSGKLSETFPIDLANTPTYKQFPGTGKTSIYQEGLFTGYRFYDTHKLPVRFPFGYGLSYTHFDYNGLKLSTNQVSDDFNFQASVLVENTGKRDGYETVMLFVGYPESQFVHPTKVLKQFKKVWIPSGETCKVTFDLTREDFKVFVSDKSKFMVESGRYLIYVGKNVTETLPYETIDIFSSDVCHAPKQLDYPADEWMKSDPEKSLLLSLESKYRSLLWWEKEEPLERILKRIQKEFNLLDDECEEILRQLGLN
ncbi:MAG: glycoside hydrolase family 3 C-terminal domain-containing protein [Candidatus Izemoplasmatales bacterium]